MSMLDSINGFVDTMIEEQHQFEAIQNKVSHCENSVEDIIARLEKRERALVESAQQKMGNVDNVADIFNAASQSLVSTMNEANQKIREAIKGMTFIQDFEKHFTIAVFGKVKAGKSYIGNFVMGNPVRTQKIASSYDSFERPVVHVYDRGNESIQECLSEQPDDNSDFATGMKETTSTIQWFDIGGMSWFDTPGIGSVTWENEMLAKEYVKNADLVIFACNSDAAGTRQEFAEMKQLYDMGKPILLLLTQSDTYESDVDDEGEEISILVPKCEKDRSDTEQYMIDTLSEQGMSDLLKYDILTISAKLAVEALEKNDEGLFEQSNMGAFLERLTAITKNDAAEMKKATPKHRLNEMIDTVIHDLQLMAEQISNACQSIEESKNDLTDREDSILEQVKSRVYLKMLEIVQEYKVKVEREKTTIGEEELSSKINEAVSKCISEVCAAEAIKSTDKIHDLEIRLTGIGELKTKQESIPYEYTFVTSQTRPPKGFWEHCGALIFDKKYYTSVSRTETRYSTFDIGINDTEITQNIMFKLGDVFKNTVSQFINTLISGYYQPIENLQRNSVAEIESAVRELNRLRL
jgi:Fe2+ transport system protein B